MIICRHVCVYITLKNSCKAKDIGVKKYPQMCNTSEFDLTTFLYTCPALHDAYYTNTGRDFTFSKG